MKNQTVPEYKYASEKRQQLNKINMRNAVTTGAITGAVLSAIGEICYYIKSHDSYSEEELVEAFRHVLVGAVDGGARGGAIVGTVQLVGKALGKDIPANSLGAVPIMAAANMSLDLAKDLYRCFITKTIDPDDLLCNVINYSFSSLASFGGSWVVGQISGQILSHGTGISASAKVAAETGASIGATFGPLGSVIGAAVGSLLFGIGAKAVVGVGSADGEKAFNECMKGIEEQIELEGYEKLYYFADAMSEISSFKLSFKSMLPCYNLISDLKEYNLHKKAIKCIRAKLELRIERLDQEKEKEMKRLKNEHQRRLYKLREDLQRQHEIICGKYRDSARTFIANSYMRYIENYDVLAKDVNSLNKTLQHDMCLHASVSACIRNRNRVNMELNELLGELMEDPVDCEVIRPIVDEIMRFMKQDELLLDKQYISFQEAMWLVRGGLYE
ncbi:MAG: hypothetical protein J5645_01335 [Lachnospiraceae bacterium]|nr:hypothetical protein [Lachnospiraceae bacterium]